MAKVRRKDRKDVEQLKAEDRLLKDLRRAFKDVFNRYAAIYGLTSEEARILRKHSKDVQFEVRFTVDGDDDSDLYAVARLVR